MRSRAPDVVLVLGDVGQMRKEAVGANDMDGLSVRQAIQGAFKFAAGSVVLGAMESDGRLTDMLDDAEDCLSLLLAHGIAEDPPKQPDVVAQRKVLAGNLCRVDDVHVRPAGMAAIEKYQGLEARW